MSFLFIDRPETDKFLSKLTEGLKDPANNPLVLHSWGIGGVGKTTLLAKIVEQHPESAISKVSFGLTSDIETPISLMKKLHEQLYPNLNDWEDNEDEFTRRYNEYQITLSKLEKDKDAKEFGKILQSSAQGLLVAERATSEVTKQGIQALMESTGITDKLNAWLNRTPATKGNVELQKLIKEPLPVLTKAFADSLRARAENQPVLLLFDTYEKGIPEIDRWLWHWLLANNELQDVVVRLVITGRNDILKQEGWRKLQQDRGFIYNKGVERFNSNLTKVYLWQIGIRKQEYFDRIYQITKGWPYYLNIIRERLGDGQDIESILQQINRGIEELLLQESDADKKMLMSQVSRIASCCQSFDRGLIKYLLVKLELPLVVDGRDCYDWLKVQHFFEEGQDRLDDVAGTGLLKKEG